MHELKTDMSVGLSVRRNLLADGIENAVGAHPDIPKSKYKAIAQTITDSESGLVTCQGWSVWWDRAPDDSSQHIVKIDMGED